MTIGCPDICPTSLTFRNYCCLPARKMNSGWSKDFLLPEYKSGITGRLLYSSSFYLQSTMIAADPRPTIYQTLPSVNTTLVNPNVTEPAGSPSQISASPRTSRTKGLTVLIEANLEEQIPSPEAAVSNAEQFAEEGIALLRARGIQGSGRTAIKCARIGRNKCFLSKRDGSCKVGQKNLPDAIGVLLKSSSGFSRMIPRRYSTAERHTSYRRTGQWRKLI